MPDITYGSHDDSRWRPLGPGEALVGADFETLAIHLGQDPDPTTGAVIPPIYATSTYAQDAVANPRWGYVYSRPANPTRRALEECLAGIEGGRFALAYPSGMAASDAVFRTLLKPGDHIIIPSDVYGGLYRLIDRVLRPWGISMTAVEISDPSAVAAAIEPGKTKIVWCETPTNPLLQIADIASLAAVTQRADIRLVVDNTLASPAVQRPLLLGADIVVHSTTKYIGGHSDLLGGVVVTNDEELTAEMRVRQNSTGAVPSPFDCWLTLRGIKTLALRVERQCQTAQILAEFLAEQEAVSRVYYPGLPDHPNHEIASKQMTGYGGIVSFCPTGGESAAIRVCEAARIFTLAESLGAVESLISHPLRMTHIGSSGSALAPAPDIVRLSIGLESPRDLQADLLRALASASGEATT